MTDPVDLDALRARHYAYRPAFQEQDICPTCSEGLAGILTEQPSFVNYPCPPLRAADELDLNRKQREGVAKVLSAMKDESDELATWADVLEAALAEGGRP